MNQLQNSTRMSRVVIDLPAHLELRELHELAEKYGCRVYRRSDGSYLFRPRKQAGFTLLEALVTLGILGILAGIALPSYGAYILRAAVYDAVVWAEPLKQVVIDNHQAGQPLDAGFAPLANPMKRVDNVTIDATTGVITLHLAAGTVAITPTSDLSGTLVGWDCYGGTLAATHRPAACQP